MKSNLRSNAKRNVVDSMRNAKTKDSCPVSKGVSRHAGRNTETNLLVGVNLSLLLFPSFGIQSLVSYRIPISSFALSFSFVHAHVSQLLRSLLQAHWNQPFFFKQYAATVSPNIDRSSCVHVIELECTRNFVSRYKCQIILVTFLDALLYDNAIYGEEETKGTV